MRLAPGLMLLLSCVIGFACGDEESPSGGDGGSAGSAAMGGMGGAPVNCTLEPTPADCVACACEREPEGCSLFDALFDSHFYCGMTCGATCADYCNSGVPGSLDANLRDASCSMCISTIDIQGPDGMAFNNGCIVDPNCADFFSLLSFCPI
jgi:hypothetical protein